MDNNNTPAAPTNEPQATPNTPAAPTNEPQAATTSASKKKTPAANPFASSQLTTIILIVVAALLLIGMVVAIIIGFCQKRPDQTIQGEAETTDYRLSSKVASRVLELRVKEGDFVRKGDTLAILEAPEIDARLSQANAAYSAATAMEEKANNGTRAEQIQAAYEQWQKARAGLDIARKTYNRVDTLFAHGVLPDQKRDEARAQYDAAIATEKAARSQYDMAINGARREDKEAATAQAQRAHGAIQEVRSYVRETVLTASADGQITEIFPEVGELVGSGAPVMNVQVVDDVWFTFNIREDLLTELKVGTKVDIYLPSKGKSYPARITRIKEVGDFATWKATKEQDAFDLKVFEVKVVPLHPIDGVYSGMSAVLNKR